MIATTERIIRLRAIFTAMAAVGLIDDPRSGSWTASSPCRPGQQPVCRRDDPYRSAKASRARQRIGAHARATLARTGDASPALAPAGATALEPPGGGDGSSIDVAGVRGPVRDPVRLEPAEAAPAG